MIGDIEKFDVIAKKLKIIAKSTTQSKDTLITGLIQLKHIVAVSADTTSDCRILGKAHVTLCLGRANEVIQQMCDIILINEDIRSLLGLIIFSRNIYSFIRKYF